jgi:alpha-tubulin suppressor-like RCC1 family protein
VAQVDAYGGIACGATTAGGAVCWGISDAQVVPTQPPTTLSGVTQVAVGNNFACAATTGGSVTCWGTNLLPPDPRVLVIPAGLTDVRSVEAGGNTVCAERQTGVVVCWGALNVTDPRPPE